MKKNLGKKIAILLYLLCTELFSSTYTWDVASNKTEAYVNEPIYLKYVCSFSDRAQTVTVVFDPLKESDKYILKDLRQSQNIVDGKRVYSYEFVAYPKVSGEIKFDFEAQVKETTKESIENTVIGRDNMQKEEFTKENVKLKTLFVNVKESLKPLVGEFSLEVKKHEPKVKAYEPFHVEYIIKGRGNFEAIKPLDFNIEGVTIFKEEPVEKKSFDENGEEGEWSQKFAFVAKGDFKIPKVESDYFNLKEQKISTLKQESIEVKVAKGYTKEELIDKTKENRFSFDFSYIYYILTFIAGFLTAKIEIKKRVKIYSEDEEFKKKIADTQSLNKLSVLLALKDPKKYEKLILDIENKKITSLKSVKKMI